MAVRLAIAPEDQEAAKLEVAAYGRLEDLQGSSIPRLVAFGTTNTRAGTAFFVATQFIQVLC